MPVSVRFMVEGKPVPQGSKSRGRNGVMYEANKNLRPWRGALAREARAAHDGEPIDAPVVVTATFYMPKPKRPKFPVPATPPDTDKLQRALGDALTMSEVVKDDARIVEWRAKKAYHPEGWVGAVVVVEEVQL